MKDDITTSRQEVLAISEERKKVIAAWEGRAKLASETLNAILSRITVAETQEVVGYILDGKIPGRNDAFHLSVFPYEGEVRYGNEQTQQGSTINDVVDVSKEGRRIRIEVRDERNIRTSILMDGSGFVSVRDATQNRPKHIGTVRYTRDSKQINFRKGDLDFEVQNIQILFRSQGMWHAQAAEANRKTAVVIDNDGVLFFTSVANAGDQRIYEFEYDRGESSAHFDDGRSHVFLVDVEPITTERTIWEIRGMNSDRKIVTKIDNEGLLDFHMQNDESELRYNRKAATVHYRFKTSDILTIQNVNTFVHNPERTTFSFQEGEYRSEVAIDLHRGMSISTEKVDTGESDEPLVVFQSPLFTNVKYHFYK